MTDHRREAPGESGPPIPRDMPDQQAHTGEDPWEVAQSTGSRRPRPEPDDVPDTDEAGTGRKGAPHSGTVHPEHPVPDEPPG